MALHRLLPVAGLAAFVLAFVVAPAVIEQPADRASPVTAAADADEAAAFSPVEPRLVEVYNATHGFDTISVPHDRYDHIAVRQGTTQLVAWLEFSRSDLQTHHFGLVELLAPNGTVMFRCQASCTWNTTMPEAGVWRIHSAGASDGAALVSLRMDLRTDQVPPMERVYDEARQYTFGTRETRPMDGFVVHPGFSEISISARTGPTGPDTSVTRFFDPNGSEQAACFADCRITLPASPGLWRVEYNNADSAVLVEAR